MESIIVPHQLTSATTSLPQATEWPRDGQRSARGATVYSFGIQLIDLNFVLSENGGLFGFVHHFIQSFLQLALQFEAFDFLLIVGPLHFGHGNAQFLFGFRGLSLLQFLELSTLLRFLYDPTQS